LAYAQQDTERLSTARRTSYPGYAAQGTRQVIDFCQGNEVSDLYIGDPDGVRNKPCGRKHNQRMSQWEYGKDIEYLEYKSEHAGISSFGGSERGTSSRCPKCGHQHKPTGRNWVCKGCGLSGHRDLVGSINMHPIAFENKATFSVSKDVAYLRPGTCCWKYRNRSSRPDTGRRKGLGPLPPALSEVCVNQRFRSDAVRRRPYLRNNFRSLSLSGDGSVTWSLSAPDCRPSGAFRLSLAIPLFPPEPPA
jgi:hypothetical protein